MKKTPEKPCAIHQGFSYRSSDPRFAVVLTHGIMGSPRQFDYLIAALGPACSVENILLPGHGASANEYAASTMADWQRRMDSKVAELAVCSEKIILVGHSLGGLLSIKAALDYPERVVGLFLIALPLSVGISSHFIRRGLAIAFDRRGKNPEVALANNTSSVSFSSWHEYIKGSTRIIELFIKIRRVKRTMSDLGIPVRVIQSQNDEIVHMRSVNYLPLIENLRLTVLEKSGHYVYTDDEKAQILGSFIDFTEEIFGSVQHLLRQV